MTKTAVVAIGGNSLIRAGEKGLVEEQRVNARRTAEAVVELVREGYGVVVTHGNGPQVGAALLRSERSGGQVYRHPLDVCVATTQGEIGYILQQALGEAMTERRSRTGGRHDPVPGGRRGRRPGDGRADQADRPLHVAAGSRGAP